MASDGPWGSGSNNDKNRGEQGGEGSSDPKTPPKGGQRPGNAPPPEVEELLRKGQEHLRILMGGGGRGSGGKGGNGGGNGPTSEGPQIKRTVGLAILGAAALWAWTSFYTVQQQERSVELLMGKFFKIGNPGLNFAPWPFVKAEILEVTNERQTDIGAARNPDEGLMLTRDQNIADIGFQVVWNISDPANYLFNLAEPSDTIRAVSESAMRDIIARSELSPILNRDRGAIARDVQTQIQNTLDSYGAGVNVIRVNFEKADPPGEVIDAFREVQAAQQERDRLEKQADAYANRVTAAARGETARLLEDAEAYRAKVVNDAQGEASRFEAIYTEYVKAPEVTRERMYLETMENVLGRVNKIIMDDPAALSGEGGGGVNPVLFLNELIKQRQPAQTQPQTQTQPQPQK